MILMTEFNKAFIRLNNAINVKIAKLVVPLLNWLAKVIKKMEI